MDLVTVLVATYHPEWKKLKMTLLSILRQTGIDYQIVICDDGSPCFPLKKVKDLFQEHNFSNYALVLNPENSGTVNNVYSAFSSIKGSYVKPISPGDCLYNEKTLERWVKYCLKNSIIFSFGDVACYPVNHPEKKISISAHPQCKDWDGAEQVKINYLLYNDIALGAATIVETQTMKKYLEEILTVVKYAEDNIYRLMIMDDVKSGYYPYLVVLYEVGEGVSTSASSKWGKLIQADWETTDRILLRRAAKSNVDHLIQKKIRGKYRNKGKVVRFFGYLSYPGLIRFILTRKFFPRMTEQTDMGRFTIEELGIKIDDQQSLS